MAVKRKTIKLRNGDILDIAENHDGNHGAPGKARQKKKKPTKEEIQKNNAMNKARRTRLRLLQYFCPGDCFATWTYEKNKRPSEMDEALSDFQKAMLQEFNYVLTPDFSLYLDYPKAIQIYNHYRKHWVGAYMQMMGCKVIPTIAWSDKESFNWCFDGEPEGGTVAVSSVGCMRDKESKNLFIDGYKEMVRRLQPETIIFYGKIPDECMGNIVHVKAFTDKFKEAKCDGW